jgi:hypothetical protein
VLAAADFFTVVLFHRGAFSPWCLTAPSKCHIVAVTKEIQMSKTGMIATAVVFVILAVVGYLMTR